MSLSHVFPSLGVYQTFKWNIIFVSWNECGCICRCWSDVACGESFSSKFLKYAGANSLVSIWIDNPSGKKSFRVYSTGHLHSLARMVTESCDSQRKIKEAVMAGSWACCRLIVYFRSYLKSLYKVNNLPFAMIGGLSAWCYYWRGFRWPREIKTITENHQPRPQPQKPNNFISVHCGRTCAILSCGTFSCWGCIRSASNQSLSEAVEQVDQKKKKKSDDINARLLEKFEADRAELQIVICNAFQLLWYKKIGR